MRGTLVTTLTVETIEQYQQWCTGRGRAPNTVRAYGGDLREFLKAAGEEGAITREEYEELAMSWLNLTRGAAAPKTTARRLTSIRGFAKWIGLVNPLEDYIAPTPGKTIPHPLPEGQAGINKMIEHAKNPQQEALVALIGKVGEARSVFSSNFDIHDMLLTIRGKGDKTRTVPVSEQAWSHIQSAFVLAHVGNTPLITYQDRFARQVITNLGKRANLRRPVSSHDLRATFATEVFDRTGNIRLVQELLGHASSETTEIYTGVQLSQMREAVNF